MSRTGNALVSKTAVHRYRFGETNTVTVPVVSSKASGPMEIATGDFIFIAPSGNAKGLTAGRAYPFSALAIAVRASVADWFAGIAMDTSCNGDSDPIQVATTGVFEVNLPPGQTCTVNVGDQVRLRTSGSTGDGGASVDCFTCSVELGYGLTDGAWTDTNRLGTAVSYGTSQTTVLVRINSRIFEGMHAS